MPVMKILSLTVLFLFTTALSLPAAAGPGDGVTPLPRGPGGKPMVNRPLGAPSIEDEIETAQREKAAAAARERAAADDLHDKDWEFGETSEGYEMDYEIRQMLYRKAHIRKGPGYDPHGRLKEKNKKIDEETEVLRDKRQKAFDKFAPGVRKKWEDAWNDLLDMEDKLKFLMIRREAIIRDAVTRIDPPPLTLIPPIPPIPMEGQMMHPGGEPTMAPPMVAPPSLTIEVSPGAVQLGPTGP